MLRAATDLNHHRSAITNSGLLVKKRLTALWASRRPRLLDHCTIGDAAYCKAHSMTIAKIRSSLDADLCRRDFGQLALEETASGHVAMTIAAACLATSWRPSTGVSRRGGARCVITEALAD